MKVGFIIDTTPTMSRRSKPSNMSFIHQTRYVVEGLVKRCYQTIKYFLATTEIVDCIKSSWEHPNEHLFRQLEYFKHSKSETNIMHSIK